MGTRRHGERENDSKIPVADIMAKHGANVCGIVAYLTDASILTKIMAMAANPAFFDDS